MNFLAHVYLSGNDDEIKIGNFIGDFVKGKDADNYPGKIKLGIYLHRHIDDFTDNHAIVLKSKKRLYPIFHHYAPVIIDVFFDHLLAKNWSRFSDINLLSFTESFYKITESFQQVIPKNASNMLIYMKKDNWLFNYQYLEGIDKAFKGMARRTKFESNMENAVRELNKNYPLFENEFLDFFPDIIKKSTKYINDHI